METGRLYINPFCGELSSSLVWKENWIEGVPAYGLSSVSYIFRLSWEHPLRILEGEKKMEGLVGGRSYVEIELHPEEMKLPYVALPPYSVAECASLEEFILPEDWVGFVFGISEYVSAGVSLLSSILPPRYRGVISFSLVNHSPKPVKLVLGGGVGCVVFFEIEKSAADFPDVVDEARNLFGLSIPENLHVR